jgi:hypothetical protein
MIAGAHPNAVGGLSKNDFTLIEGTFVPLMHWNKSATDWIYLTRLLLILRRLV